MLKPRWMGACWAPCHMEVGWLVRSSDRRGLLDQNPEERELVG